MIVMIYNPGVYKEYLLPNIMDADYTIRLEKGIFPITEDVRVLLEIDQSGWKMKEGFGYTIYRKDGNKKLISTFLKDGDIYDLNISGCGNLQMIVMDVNFIFPILEKIDLTGNQRFTVGRNPENDIEYHFLELISKHHAVIYKEMDGWYIEDISVNGVFSGYSRISGRKKLNFGEQIHIFGLHLVYLGDMLAVGASYGDLCIHEETVRFILPLPGSSRELTVKEKHYFNRSPRNMPVINTGEIEIEAPPVKNIIKQKPAFLTIGPAFTMAIPMLLGCLMMILASRSTGRSTGAFMFTGVITAVGSAVLGVFWGYMNMKYAKAQQMEEEQVRFNSYASYLIRVAEELKAKYQQNQSAMAMIYPDAAVCANYDEKCSALWNRNRKHPDFLFHRLGIGDELFQVSIKTPQKKFTMYEDLLEKKPYEIQEDYKILHQVPVGMDFFEHRLIGLVGKPDRKGATELMHIIAAQVAANNCYTDVKMVFIYDKDKCIRREDWECMKWFPHVWNQGHKTRYLASDKMEASDLFYELSGIFRRRDEDSGLTEKKNIRKPYYLLFVSHPELLEGELIRKYIYASEEKYGLTAILLADDAEELPNECEVIIQKDQSYSGLLYMQSGNEGKKDVLFDKVSAEDLECMGRRISGLEVNEVEENADIPNSLDFFEMYGVKKKEELQVPERWKKNRAYHSMRALIGKKAGEQDCYLDIHEKYHGPHGLIAGTTGSGKSEMLQTYILSLAVNFSPDDVAFFLIDFKGGGMANLFEDLPHLVGKISNLSGNQVHRAMISIKSENTRRQRIFREYGVNNINLYTRLYKNNEAILAVPHLFIVIDEFAELKKEEPDFMRELISVAQVGRSLGVHLILATQKPSGTVDDNIWSNSKFRICLRVQDRQDSVDMLHKPDAAFLTQAGRCYIQVGNDEIYEQFQPGYSGAAFDDSDVSGNSQSVMMVTRTGKAAVIRRRRGQARGTDGSVKEITQLDAMIAYLNRIAKENHYQSPMQLWLPVLPKKLLLEELESRSIPPLVQEKQQGFHLKAAIGLFDDPVNQAQQPLVVDFGENGHYAVCGTVVSGKSTFLQTLVFALLSKYSPGELNLYLLDFSSRMLEVFQEAPQVGGIIFENEEDRTGKFFYMIRQMMKERKELLKGGNYSQYVRAYGMKLPAVVICIDHVANFREKTNNRYDEDLIQISREGVGYGIYLMLSSAGFGMAEIPNRVGDNIRNVICLEMGDKYKYMDALHTTKIMIQPEADIKGRGIAHINGVVLEFQTALALDAPDDFERGKCLEEFCRRKAEENSEESARRIPEIPKEPQLADLEELKAYSLAAKGKHMIPFAYNVEDASLYGVNLADTYCYTILGPARSGKKNTLRALMAGVEQKEGECCIMEFSSSDFKRYGEKGKFTYVSTPKEMFDYWKGLTPIFIERNQKKKQFLEQGFSEEEIFAEMKELFLPVFLFIADVADFFRTVYASNPNVGSMKGFVENIISKGSLHNIYFIGALDTADAAGCTYKAYYDFVNYKRGICLGRLSGQRLFSFAGLSYTQQNKMMKRGMGVAVEEESEARYLIVPQVRR